MSKSNVPEILRKDAGTYERKAADYAPGTDPYENFQFSAEFAHRLCEGLPTDDRRRATATLIGVKISRLQTLGLARAANNEGILDTIGDLRVYLGILEDQQRLATSGAVPKKTVGFVPVDDWRHHKPLSAETRIQMLAGLESRFAAEATPKTEPPLEAFPS